MKALRRFIESLTARRDPRSDWRKAVQTARRSERLIADNRAVLDDIRRMERGIEQ